MPSEFFLLAAIEPWFYAGAIAIFAALIFFSFVILLVKQYKRCPSNRVLVIYGRTGKGQTGSRTGRVRSGRWPATHRV